MNGAQNKITDLPLQDMFTVFLCTAIHLVRAKSELYQITSCRTIKQSAPLVLDPKASSQLIPASQLSMQRLSPLAPTCSHKRKTMLASREPVQETHRVSSSLVNLCSTCNTLLACLTGLISFFPGLLSAHKESGLGLSQQLLRNSFQQYKDLLHLEV